MAQPKDIRHRYGFPLLLLGVVLVVGLAWTCHWVNTRLGPVDPGAAETVVVNIPSGAGTGEVAQILYEHGLIADPTVFRWYVRYRGLDAEIRSGEYALSPAMRAEEILTYLVEGRVRVGRITVPEGLTVAMIADLLDANGVVEREAFLAAATAAAARNPYLPDDRDDMAQPMEGYLFPATYEYTSGTDAEDLVDAMFRRFQQVWTPELTRRAAEMGLSIHEVVTLAAIVETEAQVPAERPTIAGVYLNRLAIGMPLQADPTVYYAADVPRTQELTWEHLRFDSPYNTYVYPGLPPGPIAAPGEEAIRAVLYPERHDYYYFVAKADGSGEHYFGRTLAEHEENVARAEANKAE